MEEQLELLVVACAAYDAGRKVMAKAIATHLRVLLHESKTSKPLLEQIKQRNGFFYDTNRRWGDSAGDRPLWSRLVLLAGHLLPDSKEMQFVPVLGMARDPYRKRSFERWWTDPVVWNADGTLFSRKDIVTSVADTDGGAHVDAGLDPAYAKLKKEGIGMTRDGTIHSVSWNVGNVGVLRAALPPSPSPGPDAAPSSPPETTSDPLVNLEGAVLRQIAHEVLLTLRRRQISFKEPYPH